MNLAYSYKLKQIAIIDVIIIAIGFLLRIYVGGFSVSLPISVWAILVTFFLALIMAIAKRRGELINVQITGQTRKALYNKTESPTKVVYKDLFLQIDLILWLIMVFILKYLN